MQKANLSDYLSSVGLCESRNTAIQGYKSLFPSVVKSSWPEVSTKLSMFIAKRKAKFTEQAVADKYLFFPFL